MTNYNFANIILNSLKGLIFGTFFLFIWRISSIKIGFIGIVIFFAIILLTVLFGNKTSSSVIQPSPTLQKQKITTKMIFQRLAQLGVIVLILLFFFTPAGEEKEEEIRTLQLTSSEGMKTSSPAGSRYVKLENLEGKDKEAILSSESFSREKIALSFFIEGDDYEIESWLFRNPKNGGKVEKYKGLAKNSSGQKTFEGEFICPDKYRCTIDVIVRLPKNGWITMTNISLV